jgi:hypothetical protein
VKSIDNGEYKLAMIPFKGFEEMEIVHSTELNPVNNASVVINAKDKFEVDRKTEKFYITLELWKKSGSDWTNKELKPIRRVKIAKDGKSVEVIFTNGEKRLINF